MFIDVTRYGGLRLMRLNAAAIAYVDAVQDGSAIHLVGGETLRVNEDPATIEARCSGEFPGTVEETATTEGPLPPPDQSPHAPKVSPGRKRK